MRDEILWNIRVFCINCIDFPFLIPMMCLSSKSYAIKLQTEYGKWKYKTTADCIKKIKKILWIIEIFYTYSHSNLRVQNE